MFRRLCVLFSKMGDGWIGAHQATTLGDSSRAIHTTAVNGKVDIRNLVKSLPKLDEGVQTLEVDSFGFKDICELPPPDMLNRVYDGVKYSDMHKIHCVFTKNNTKLYIMNSCDEILVSKSCRSEGFKHCRKATSVAATAAALAISKAAQYKGYKNLRLTMRGLGPGRMATIQQLAKSNLNFISISDFSDFSAVRRLRPKKMRRV